MSIEKSSNIFNLKKMINIGIIILLCSTVFLSYLEFEKPITEFTNSVDSYFNEPISVTPEKTETKNTETLSKTIDAISDLNSMTKLLDTLPNCDELINRTGWYEQCQDQLSTANNMASLVDTLIPLMFVAIAILTIARMIA